YRSKPHCGGQGVYVRHLSRELVALGHTVEVFSGQPYPDLDEGVTLTKVPSLDLYREPDPFRVPALREFRDRVDVEEFLTMSAAADAAALVRLPAHAEAGGAPGAAGPDAQRGLQARCRRGVRRRPRPDAGHLARRRRGVPPADRAAGAGPGPGHGQRGRPDE